ncbi:cupin domain-containing protein [Mucilaginibacter sp. PAMB04168]|uniref:cupin domain-containing protein n=1 Tax=Mucilaginibacter sp. PAMB04168 TaxID=3138567 RepID=UPI0031F6D8F8
MLRTGDKISNPLTKKTFVFLRTAKDTDGEYVRIKCIADPESSRKNGFVHVHPSQTEIITVSSGSMMALVNGKKVRFDAGEMLVIKPGDAHQWWNASTKQQLEIITEVRPAMQTEQLYEAVCALANARYEEHYDSLNLLQFAVMLDHYSEVYKSAGKLTLLKKGVFKVLAALGRLKGYKPEWDYKLVPKSV